MVAVPSTEDQSVLVTKLKDLIKAIESEPAWTPPKPHAGLLHVWDFVQRTHYMMLNVENIRTGAPIEHPEAIPKNDKGIYIPYPCPRCTRHRMEPRHPIPSITGLTKDIVYCVVQPRTMPKRHR
jgi:hypothetical protein